MKMGGGGSGGPALWVQKADFPRVVSKPAGGGVIGTKLYVGGGLTGGVGVALFHEWDMAANVWTNKANMPQGIQGFNGAVPCSIGTKVYLGPGQANAGLTAILTNLYEWDQGSNTWATKSSFPVSIAGTFMMCSDGIDLYAFIVNSPATTLKCYRWTQGSNTWTQIASVVLTTLTGMGATSSVSHIYSCSFVGQYCFVPLLAVGLTPINRFVAFDKVGLGFSAVTAVPTWQTNGGITSTTVLVDSAHPGDSGQIFVISSDVPTNPTDWNVYQGSVNGTTMTWRTGTGRTAVQGLEDPPDNAYAWWWGTISDQVFYLDDATVRFWLRTTAASGGLGFGLSMN